MIVVRGYYYKVDGLAMQKILFSIPNTIFASVDSQKTGKLMWERVRRLMHGTKLTQMDMETRLVDIYDKFKQALGDL